MSLESQTRIFTRLNMVVYIPLSIMMAHILNFAVNSPLSTWQEFPPKLPNSIYASTFFTPLFLFISLTFEPIQTRKRFYTLLALALIFISIPLSFRKENYPFSLHNSLVAYGSIYGMKMLLFLKNNRAYCNQKNSKQFKSYLWSLFNWRFDSKSAQIIESPTTSYINKILINRFIIIIMKQLIYELTNFIAIKYRIEFPEKPYQVRLIGGNPAVTVSSMLYYLNFVGLLYCLLSIYYDIMNFILIIIYRIFFHSASEKNERKPILIQSSILSTSEYVHLKEWFIETAFNTKHFFSEPWMASSPRDFWSFRWHSTFNELYKELGYLPARNLFSSIFSRKISNMFGVLGALGISALQHEYLIIGQFDYWTGEHFFFFMMHGVIFILWEAIFGYENKNDNSKIKRFSRWILLASMYLSIMPAFVEPMARSYKCLNAPSYFDKYYNELSRSCTSSSCCSR